MHYTTLCIATLASMAVALPADSKAVANKDSKAVVKADPKNPYARVIDPWGKIGHKPTKRSDIELWDDEAINSTTVRIAGEQFDTREILDLARRAAAPQKNIKSFIGGIPGCGSKDDPSNKDTPKPPYAVNQGVRIPRSGDNDECTKGSGKAKCWTVYYLVEAAVEYMDWQPTGAGINCPAAEGGSCSSQITSLTSSCSTTGTTESHGFDKTFQASLSGTWNSPKKDADGQSFSVAGTVGGQWTWTQSTTDHDLKQVCKSDSSSATCSWDTPKGAKKEDLCHQVWFADRVLHVWGQAQRECNKCSGDGVQQNTGDGTRCVRGQKQFEFLIPINKLIHCDGVCNLNTPGVPPVPSGEKLTYETPKNWDILDLGNLKPA